MEISDISAVADALNAAKVQADLQVNAQKKLQDAAVEAVLPIVDQIDPANRAQPGESGFLVNKLV